MKILNGLSCTIFWIMSLLLSGMSEASIKLDQPQGSSIYKCTSGLVEGRDRVHLKSHVPDFNHPVDFQIKTKESSIFVPLCSLFKLQSDSVQCKKSSEGNSTVDIYINANATLSEALIRGRVNLKRSILESEIRTLPKIYDPKKSDITLQANRKYLDISRCQMKLEKPILHVLFRCNETNALPCTLMVQDHHNNETDLNNEGLLSFCAGVKKELRVTFSYTFCHSNRSKSFECVFTRDAASRETDNCQFYLIVLIVLFVLFVLSPVITIVLINSPQRYIEKKMCEIYLQIKTYRASRNITSQDATEQLTVDNGQLDNVGQSSEQTQLLTSCDRQPQHKHVIDAEHFTIENLPPKYGREKMFKLIRIVAKLTVKINVTNISSARESHILQDTSLAYSLPSNNTQSSSRRSGSGRIFSVVKFRDGIDELGNTRRMYRLCPCSRCKESKTPSSTWGMINISTSTSLVFDGAEAMSSTCIFSIYGKEYTLNDISINRTSNKTNFCSIVAYTCNIKLVDTLIVQLEKLKKTYTKIYSEPCVLRSLFGQVLVVFYPHGEKQKVSLGQLVRIEIVRDVGTRVIYSAHTSPGSCGAPVTVIGSRISWASDESQFIHCGHINEDSCTGFVEIR